MTTTARKYPDRPEELDTESPLGRAFASGGPQGVWKWQLGFLQQMSQGEYVSSYDFATTYSLLGDRERALDIKTLHSELREPT